MRARVLGRRFIASLRAARVSSGTDDARALWATMQSICEQTQLPLYCDELVIVPPVQVSYVRRVRDINLWLHFLVRPDRVVFTYVVSHPPLPGSPFDCDDDDG